MTPTILTPLLTDFLAILNSILGAFASIVGWMITNPLVVFGVILGIVGVAFRSVRSFVRH